MLHCLCWCNYPLQITSEKLRHFHIDRGVRIQNSEFRRDAADFWCSGILGQLGRNAHLFYISRVMLSNNFCDANKLIENDMVRRPFSKHLKMNFLYDVSLAGNNSSVRRRTLMPIRISKKWHNTFLSIIVDGLQMSRRDNRFVEPDPL